MGAGVPQRDAVNALAPGRSSLRLVVRTHIRYNTHNDTMHAFSTLLSLSIFDKRLRFVKKHGQLLHVDAHVRARVPTTVTRLALALATAVAPSQVQHSCTVYNLLKVAAQVETLGV